MRPAHHLTRSVPAFGSEVRSYTRYPDEVLGEHLLKSAFPLTRNGKVFMSWWPRFSLTPALSGLRFVKDAPGIRVRYAKPGIIDAPRIAQLTDAVSSLREELSEARDTEPREP
jgi:hypothetical protein